ncbi:D-hexose-6-phosphate mutarotase [Arenicella chitinivorans]|uniref:Putative glucose-6-phosphate 1-epimerase n=1 Tax=Arenicella chitinivorans TaxID=1329800 RepID=A0A918S1V7_9GAMM|nr:D-hexose-6-phosphate mutarotase [Arenicella chitinivorans]GHA17902.1 D-hexose-6-phosphate mutarotase [Arenicella chitinivorans]
MNKKIDTQLDRLRTRFAECVDATFFRKGDLLGLCVDNSHGSATLLLQGAQLLEYTPSGHDPVIWCSDAVVYKQGVPLRGGVPICWPWFGPLANNVSSVQSLCGIPIASAPQHGFVRTLEWELLRVESLTDARTALELRLCDSPATQTMLACAFELTLRIEIGSCLSMHLVAKNTDSRANLTFTSALHSYFAVSDIYQTDVQGLDAVSYVDILDGGAIKHQQGAVNFDTEVDRIYFAQPGAGLTPLVIQTPKRDIELLSRGSDSAIVWNPWIEKSQRLSQFNEDDYQSMVCVETANAFNDVISLAPGESHQLTLTASIVT